MKTVTLVAHNRPGYTAEVIGALTEALLKPSDSVFDKLIISIDPGNSAVTAICEKAAEILAESGIIEGVVYQNVQKFGVAGNAYIALQRAFEEHGSDFNLYIEDDALLMPDAAVTADWFYKCHGGPFSDYTLFGLCNHRDYGRGQNKGGIKDDPSYMVESSHIPSPFAWCTTKWQWPFIKASWDRKWVPPTGWDWSLSYAMRLERRRALHPVLSRCRNIGREGGEHETPETFDQTQTGLVYSDGSFEGEYKIVAKIPEEELMRLDDWMVAERWRELGK